MKTILRILKQAGGWHPGLSLRINNPTHPTLVVEALDESGPLGLPALSVAQYRNALASPEMHFELGSGGLTPFYYRNDLTGVEQVSRAATCKHYAFLPDLLAEHIRLAEAWDRQLRKQGFAKAFERQQQGPSA